MSSPHAAQVETIRTIPNPAVERPRFAWPTIALFVGGWSLWTSSTALALAGFWPWPVSALVNCVAAFILFTVSHEASHNAISTHGALNDWLGRLSLLAWVTVPIFGTYRFVHSQHHRFTNHDDGRDPEHYNQRGPGWLLPLRWVTQDLFYMTWYLPQFRDRPRRERVEFGLAWLFTGSAFAALALTGNWLLLFGLWLGPARLTLGLIGWAFDYLPHHGLDHTPDEDRAKATRNRVFAERVLTPLLMYQNYHLVHHLHPLIPFYRYISTWRRAEDDYLAAEPALTTPLGRPLTPEEYRALREMD